MPRTKIMSESKSPILTLLLLVTACSSGPSFDPDLEKQLADQDTQEKQRLEDEGRPERVILKLDQAIDKYVEGLSNQGLQRADHLVESMTTYIRQTVRLNFPMLLSMATEQDGMMVSNRAIAVAALGFSEREEALDPLLNALASKHQTVITNAAFGLRMLRDPRTPAARLGEIIENEKVRLETRVGASDALLELQPVLHNSDAAVLTWARLAYLPLDEIDPAIQLHAVRGLGLTRDARHADTVLRFAKHSQPLIRCATAVALARLGKQDSYKTLLTMLGPGETNQNVRLYARKALMALAGGVDVAYDVDEWTRLFERGDG